MALLKFDIGSIPPARYYMHPTIKQRRHRQNAIASQIESVIAFAAAAYKVLLDHGGRQRIMCMHHHICRRWAETGRPEYPHVSHDCSVLPATLTLYVIDHPHNEVRKRT